MLVNVTILSSDNLTTKKINIFFTFLLHFSKNMDVLSLKIENNENIYCKQKASKYHQDMVFILFNIY